MTISLFLRNLFFTLLQPGIVAGLIPYLLVKDKARPFFGRYLTVPGLLGMMLFVAGMFILLACIARFGTDGDGTLSPADPTKKLVISGLYKFSRNPMYVGVMLILIGETIFFQSLTLLLYSLFIFISFQVFIIYREEPRLKRDFGEEYAAYQGKVRRWI